MRCRILIAVTVLSLLLPFCTLALDATNAPATPDAKSETNISADDMMRTYLQLQEQLHETRLAIERTRQEADYAAATNAAALSNRLQALERSLADQRTHELDTVRNTNRAMLIIAGTFVSVGLVALLLTAYMHWRAVNRLAEIATALPAGHAATTFPLAAIGMGENQLITGSAADQISTRLLGTLEQLEKRINQLEHPQTPNGHVSFASPALPAAGKTIIEASSEVTKETSASSQAARIAMLLGKGQSLLNLDKAEEALACFDEVLGLSPDNTDALVKKGATLEKLRKPQEAIECYDRAIVLDSSLTIAYLYKGGLFNRLERFSEAMECYERALHTQEKRRAA